jgi:oligosaccharide repeat unit polymerase
MLVITTAALAALTLLMLVAARNTLFPPVLFCGTWLVTMLGLLVAGDIVYDAGEYAYLVFLTGALAFSAGGIVMLGLCGRPPAYPRAPVKTPRVTRTALDILLLLLCASFPYYLRLAFSIAGTTELAPAVNSIRQQTIESEGQRIFGTVGANLAVVASLTAVAMVYETDGTWLRRLRALVAAVVALAYSMLTGSKGGTLLLLTLFLVTQVRAGRIRIGATLGVLTVVLAFFVAGLTVINFSGQRVTDVQTASRALGLVFVSYWLGAPVAFGTMAERPDSMDSSENIGRFFMETGRSLGLDVTVPSLYDKYALVGPGIDTNTYTVYFSYFKDYGWWGTVLLLAALGAFLTLLWKRALMRNPVAILMYSLLCKDIVMSFYAENFFLDLNGLLKAMILYSALYYLLPSLAGATAGKASPTRVAEPGPFTAHGMGGLPS